MSLTVTIISFSYRTPIPTDPIHGGGFVFDCRSLPNPGRELAYKALTGLDDEVRVWLKAYPEVARFFELTKSLTFHAIENYLSRGFDRLMVCYGCTGGQHRSVYLASLLNLALTDFQGVDVRQGVDLKIEHRGLIDLFRLK